MSGRSAKHHVQTYVSQDLYEQILREAAVQRQTVSECIRAALEEIYAIREELGRPLEREPGDGSPGARLGHRVLGQFEERIVGGFSRQIDEIQALREQLRRLEAMLDRQYVGLMLQLPDVGPDEEQKRSAGASRRYHAWRRAVDKLLGSSKPRP